MSYSLWRPWCLTWGATSDEATSGLPGDDLLEDADIVSTRAISIAAPSASRVAMAGPDGIRYGVVSTLMTGSRTS